MNLMMLPRRDHAEQDQDDAGQQGRRLQPGDAIFAGDAG